MFKGVLPLNAVVVLIVIPAGAPFLFPLPPPHQPIGRMCVLLLQVLIRSSGLLFGSLSSVHVGLLLWNFLRFEAL